MMRGPRCPGVKRVRTAVVGWSRRHSYALVTAHFRREQGCWAKWLGRTSRIASSGFRCQRFISLPTWRHARGLR